MRPVLLAALALALLPVQLTAAEERPARRDAKVQAVLDAARGIAYERRFGIDLSHTEEGLFAISFFESGHPFDAPDAELIQRFVGPIEVPTPSVAAFHLMPRGRSVRYRVTLSVGRLPKIDRSAPTVAELLRDQEARRAASKILARFLEELEAESRRRQVPLKKAGSRVLGLLLAEEPIDLKHDPLLYGYLGSAVDRFAGLGAAWATRRMAAALYRHGDLGEARLLLEQATDRLAAILGDGHPAVLSAAGDLAVVQLELGDYRSAIGVLRELLPRVRDAVGNRDSQTATAAYNLGAALLMEQELEEARTVLELALEVARDADPLTLKAATRLALVLFELGEYEAALERLELAQQVRERLEPRADPGDAVNLEVLLAVTLSRTGEIERARSHLERVVELSSNLRPLAPHPVVAQSLAFYGGLLESLGAIEGAVQLASRVLDVYRQAFAENLPFGSSSHRELLFDAQMGPLNWIVSLHAGSAPDSEPARRLGFKAVLERKSRLLEAAVLLRFGRGGDESRPRAGPRRSEWTTPDTEALGRALAADSALIELFLFVPVGVPLDEGLIRGTDLRTGPARYVAYVLLPSGELRSVDLGPAGAIDNATAELRAAVAGRQPDVRTRARALDALTMARLRPLLGDATSLIVSPDGSLNLVPFGALVDEAGRYLIERYDLTYVGSGRDVLAFGQATPLREAPLIVGGVDFDRSQTPAPDGSATAAQERADLELGSFSTLPATVLEVRAIADILALPDSGLLMGEAATETAIRQARGPRILHIASHGFFLPAPPESDAGGPALPQEALFQPRCDDPLLRSGLALAGANRRAGRGSEDDGLLTALEVSDLDLEGTEIVVLSACETGVGEVQNGEGVFGLRRALVLAGARTQVMSLWQVADEATKDLMISWYRQILDGVPRAEAMRRVQLAALRGEALPATQQLLRGGRRINLAAGDSAPTLAGTRHPYYWASFIVSGEPGPLPAVGERAR